MSEIKPTNHADCPAFLRDGMARLGCEVTVSTLPPVVRNDYDQGSFTCPHGVEFFMEPTSEQIYEWARDGVR